LTSEDVRSELERSPFLPIRLHLVSGKTLDVQTQGAGWMLQNAILVLDRDEFGDVYHLIALRNIEMIERIRNPTTSSPIDGSMQ
jgi:hypothetical protein